MEETDNKVLTGEYPLQTCYVIYSGDGMSVLSDDIKIPDGLEDNPFAAMEDEWITLWGGFDEAHKFIDEFEETDEDLENVSRTIQESDLTDAQKNWAKAIYMFFFHKRHCPFGEELTIEDFVSRK